MSDATILPAGPKASVAGPTRPFVADTGASAGAAELGLVFKVALAYAAVAALYLLCLHFIGAHDYVGPDNDDTMRLMEVRDLLSGQGWFDMHQYRLGLAGGTLMHWSRLIDLPIANLIALFSLVLPRESAEAAALAVWPSLTIVPLMFGMALAGYRLGGRVAMHAAAFLAALYVVCIPRFKPGAIDHHNVQMALVVTIAAMLLDREHRAASFRIAGVLTAVALAIGAETTPHMAVVCAIVAGLWLWHGEAMRAGAQAFGFALAMSLSFLFFALTPPSAYSTVTCDSLSTGFYTLATVGGGLLFLAASFASQAPFAVRLAALGGIGAVTGGLAVTVAPQCLGNPLATLDPLLVKLWLNQVTEAQSIFSILAHTPFTASALYAVPVLGLAVCAWRIVKGRGREREAHLVLGALIAVSLAITLFQVRGAPFAALTASMALAPVIAAARARYRAMPKSVPAALAFLGITVGSVPVAWAFSGSLAAMALDAKESASDSGAALESACRDPAALAPLAHEPVGVVASVSNLGDDILRFSPHRVLSAPYHRNQGGMLTALHIGLATPHDAEAFLRGAGVTLLAFCPSDPEAAQLARLKPQGLYGALTRGEVPAYLAPLAASKPGAALTIYRVLPDARP